MAECTLVERFNGKLSQYIISAQASQRKFEIEPRKCGALIFPLSLLSDPSLDPLFRIFKTALILKCRPGVIVPVH